MSRYNKDLGDFGEMVTVSYLEKEGYKILDKNFRAGGCEIDIIAENEKYLVFVEVKTRSSNKFGNPSTAVNSKKMQHMVLVAEAWLLENETEKEIRFDVAEVYAKIVDLNPVCDEINYISGIIIDV